MKKRTNVCVRPDDAKVAEIDLHSSICRITSSAWVRLACREKIARDRQKVAAIKV